MNNQFFTPEEFMNFLKKAEENKDKKELTPEYVKQCIDNSVEQMKKEKVWSENYMMAYELIPESFTKIDMLYIPCQINGVDIKVFIDTGAQVSVMNRETVIKCDIEHLVDKRCQTEVVGVGSQHSLGRIHCVDMYIGSHALPCSFTVLENGPDIIFGLNMMLSHGCKLDLENKYIEIGDEKIPFLSGADVPTATEQFNGQNQS